MQTYSTIASLWSLKSVRNICLDAEKCRKFKCEATKGESSDKVAKSGLRQAQRLCHAQLHVYCFLGIFVRFVVADWSACLAKTENMCFVSPCFAVVMVIAKIPM